MSKPRPETARLSLAFVKPDPDPADEPVRRGWRRRAWRVTRWFLLIGVVLMVAVTAASFGYNFSTNGPAPRPSGLLMARGGGFDTRYREWGTTGTPIVLVPGAFETADTFASLGPVLGADHRVFAIDLTGTRVQRGEPAVQRVAPGGPAARVPGG